ncbi:Rv2578c family radical SAM protein [Microbacterium profundi]|uniref:Rv2578c family radical SAM protein n=1 Tax=Microbacterium profundi TaxID=450380 RepID=UPI001F26C4B3|nr:Rv2578c family radical SAM protein [Microbacterium profundi]MCE7481111.1 Rv2578c family radical SAM protein [Microbacterium profundi]
MRWQGQTIDDADGAALPGMENRTGIVRSVTTPEFAGMTFHEVLARSALNHVPSGSRMPFSWTINPYRGCSHACVYCVSPDTLVLCADGRQRRIDDLLVGDEIIGTERQGNYRRYVRTRVLAKWGTQKPAYRVTLADGTVIIASGDHRFLTDRGWKHVADAERGQRPHLTANNRLMGFGAQVARPEILQLITSSMTELRIPHVSEPPRPNGVSCVRVTGGLPQRQRFFDLTQPAIMRKLGIEGSAVKSASDLRIVAVDALGETRDLVDITTGTGDFIANGVISHNCFARGTHEYLDLDGGGDFDSQIVVKTNVAEVLAKELRKGSWQHESVALGTNTDPYQRAEGRYKLMPDIIRALAESGTPFSILTKGTLIRRDIPILRDAAKHVPIDIQMSIAMYDDALQHSIEPGTPSTQARLDTVRALTDAGFRVGVFLMPVLPHLTDSVAAIDHALQRIEQTGADHVIYGALHLRAGVKPWFMQWLGREHPELMSSYRELYPGAAADAPKAYRQWLAKRVRPLIRAHGLEARHSDDDAYPARQLTRPTHLRTTAAAQPAPTLF